MVQVIALTGCFACIAALFWGSRNGRGGVSAFLLVPWIWMLILGSRAPSLWFGTSETSTVAARYTEGNAAESMIYGALILTALLVLNFRARKIQNILFANRFLLLFCIYCLVSLLWSDFPFITLKRWIKGMGTLIMVLVLLTEENPQEAIRRFLTWSAYVLLPLSALFIVFFPHLGVWRDTSTHVTYYIGVTTQKNELGQTCLCCGVGSLWSCFCAFRDRGGIHRIRRMIVDGLMVLLAYALIITCDSMTSFSCLIAASIVMVLLRRTYRLRAIHWMVGGVISLAAFASLLDSSGLLLRMLGRDATLTGRTDIWKAVLQQQTNPLFGSGFESFWLGDRIERVWQIIGYKGIAETHNGYLEIYINLGWIGIALLVLLIFSGYSNALRCFGSNPDMGRLQIALFIASLIFNLSESGFRMITSCWMIFLLATIACIPSGSGLHWSSSNGESFSESEQHEVKILY